MKLGYDLSITQTQKLKMTPELIQAIKILQFNSQDLETYVEEQILSNPVLETTEPEPNQDEQKRDEALSDILKEYVKDDYKNKIKSSGDYYDPDNETNYEQYISKKETLQEHLMLQLNVAIKDKESKDIGEFIIESLDDSGYMTVSIPEMVKILNVSKEKLEDIIYIIQNFDPIGICAENLVDCLSRQLEQRGLLSLEVETILNEYLDDFAANKLNSISKALGITTKEVQDIGDLIRSLNPRPGMIFDNNRIPSYIVPDIYVEKDTEGYVARLNEGSSPRLTVSSFYKKLLTAKKQDKQLSEYLSNKIESAVWLVRSIEQRKSTILSVANTVVKYQTDFFDNGTKHLKTLTLKMVADELSIHESTVSRAINGKYLECDFGVFEMKYFFSAGVLARDGESGISSNSIKNYIKEFVSNEDPKKPLSDQKLVDLLKGVDIDISRRTVAKYRDEIKIPSSSKRKRF